MTQHRLCAQFSLRNGYGLLAIVDTEDEAVKKGMERNAASFRICDADVRTPEDDVPWVLSPTTEYSEKRYLGVDRTFGIDEFIAETAKRATALQASESPSDKGTGDALAFVADLMTRHRDSFNEVAYIRNPSPYAKDWDFVPLKTGEKAFDSSGAQIWPRAPKR
jgi:hypothetical protein